MSGAPQAGSGLEIVLAAAPTPFLPWVVGCAVLLAYLALKQLRQFREAASNGVGQGAAPHEGQGVSSARIYRTKASWIFAQVAVGVVLALAGIAGIWVFGTSMSPIRDTAAALLLVFLCASLASFAVMIIADACVSRLAISGGVLDIVDIWGVRRMRREDIADRRTVRRGNSPGQVIFTFKDPARRAVKLPLVFSIDPQFDEWLRPIPDADAIAAAALEADIRSAAELGGSPEERLANFARARQYAQYGASAALALYLWSVLYPRPYLVIIGLLMLLPWAAVGLMVRYPGVYQVAGTSPPSTPAASRRPDLAAMILSAGIVLALRATMDVHTLGWEALAPWAVAAGALLGSSVFRVNRGVRRGWQTALVIILGSCAYGYGAATIANAVLDRSTPSIFRPLVLGKHSSTGRHTTYHLLLTPWGDRKVAENVTVSPTLFRAASVGEPVCVVMRSGALGSGWYRVALCEGPTTQL
jgi:hypothetical protein